MMTNQSSLAAADRSEEEVAFSLAGALRRARRVLPIALGVCAYGLTFGVLARQAGLSVLEVFLMSSLVYAGSAQLIVLSLWTMPLPIGMIVLTTLIVNVRNVLLGAALSPWFLRLPAAKGYATCFFLSDENWALTLGELEHGGCDGAFLLGSGLVMFVAWVGSTVLGRTLGAVIQNPAQWGLDFAFSAVFLALLVPCTILVAIVAPAVLGAGFAEVGAALATLLVAMRTRNVLLSMLVGL